MTKEGSPLPIHELPSVHFDERVSPAVDTIIIHSMYNPNSSDMFSAQSCKAILDEYEVSTHYIVDKSGVVWRLVGENMRAWHAGKSKMPDPDGRESVNHFSIGIELVGTEQTGFTDSQYRSLAILSAEIIGRNPITNIFGHSHVAPDRKTDPWNFDFSRLKSELVGLGVTTENLRFPL